jgi:hypothetical protein
VKTGNPKHARYPMPIREWSVDDRTWEKLLKYGEHILNPSMLSAFSFELIIAIMIKAGSPGRSAVRMGRQ